MKIHIYHHVCPCEENDNDILQLLKKILAILQAQDNEAMRQEIWDKLDKLQKDIVSTIP